MSKEVLKLSSPIKVNGETIKELGYDVKIENKRFYTEAIIKW